MEIFGFVMLVAFGLLFSVATLISLAFGGLDLSCAKLRYWIACLPLLFWGWYEIIKLSPFTVQFTG